MIFTIPNILSFFRILIIPLLIYFLIQDSPKMRLFAIVIFFLASITDFLDGYLARKLNQDSKLGRFLDPIADKFLVVTVLFAFYYLDKGISLWMILLIIIRDTVITMMRFLAIRKGTELKTSRMGKTKTAIQMTAIVTILLIFFIRSYGFDIQQTFYLGHLQRKGNMEIALGLIKKGVHLLPDKTIGKKEKRRIFAESMPYFIMLLTTTVTVASGLRYIYTNYAVLLPPYFPEKKGVKKHNV